MMSEDQNSKRPLSVTHPELAQQAVDWDPGEFTAGSNKKKLWRCSAGHEWEALISNRSRGRGCRECANKANSEKRIGLKLNTLQFLLETHPEIAKEIIGITRPNLKKIKTNSAKTFTWQCSKGHEYLNTPNNRTNGQNCPYCSGRNVLAGFNDLATTHPKLSNQALGWDPKTISFGMSKKLPWKCELGHTWEAIVNLRSSQETECPICAGKIVLAGFNDLATTHPEIAGQAFGWDPTKFTYGSQKKLDWICPEGHKWKTSVSNRTPSFDFKASRKQKLIPTEGIADLRMSSRIQDQISTLAKYIDSRFLDDEGFKADPITQTNAIKSIATTRGSGCPTCAISGFDPNSDGWLYFLSHPQWQMLQIGITNFPKDRLKSHAQLGWKLIELRGPMDGLIVRQWETSILRMLKRNGAELSPADVAGKFDGYTESWILESFPAKSLRELIDRVLADENEFNAPLEY